MYHPLYPVACRLVGRPVVAHHISGSVHRGLLQSVSTSGIYMLPHMAPVSFSNGGNNSVAHAMHETDGDCQATLVFAPAAFFGFGALTGLALGAALTAPYYGYGYGYGGYWW